MPEPSAWGRAHAATCAAHAPASGSSPNNACRLGRRADSERAPLRAPRPARRASRCRALDRLLPRRISSIRAFCGSKAELSRPKALPLSLQRRRGTPGVPNRPASSTGLLHQHYTRRAPPDEERRLAAVAPIVSSGQRPRHGVCFGDRGTDPTVRATRLARRRRRRPPVTGPGGPQPERRRPSRATVRPARRRWGGTETAETTGPSGAGTY